jgi:hypothetical protein
MLFPMFACGVSIQVLIVSARVFISRDTVHCGTLFVLKSGLTQSLPSTCFSSK